MAPTVNPDLLARLGPKLKPLLEAELAAGNEVVGTEQWIYASVEILVMLKEEFKTKPPAVPQGVLYEESTDHWLSSGILCDYRCETQVADDRQIWHVLRSIRKEVAVS